ncbi:hypothetical protein [Streptomyces litchfieldiae]|uniref:Uncharacterized protein n=1 Tax=Streptomyces litchfieldiae TaxID=3075543 RepID=A0ABU2MKB5_9ACTN|nr:hypothetical protein [Streptomyces sp. DSM 44938]MDT0342051.1 hypothetical protein [Streptomyces sp. DSM 44938]
MTTNDMNDRNGYGYGDVEPDYERELGAMLRQAGTAFHTDTEALVAGGLRRGRARLWRRRVGAVAGAATAVAAIGVAAVQLPGGGGDDGGPPAIADTPELTDEDMIDALTGLLPSEWEISEPYVDGPEVSGDPIVSVTADDGSGPFEVTVSLTRYGGEDWREMAGCVGIPGCQEREQPDGLRFSTLTETYPVGDAPDLGGGTSGTEEEPFHSWEVWLEGPGTWSAEAPGMWQVSVMVSRDGRDGTPPPLDWSELGDIAYAQVWQDAFEAATAEHGPPPEDGGITGDWAEDYSDIPSADLVAVLRDLVPEGQTVTQVGDTEEPGAAYTELDDGAGPVAMDITAYAAYDMMPDDDTAVFESLGPECVVTGADGGVAVETCSYPPDEASSWGLWTVTAVWPDGTALSLSQQNTNHEDTVPTREGTPLSVDQLRDIATDPAWAELLAGR